jgi:hypothetical protein
MRITNEQPYEGLLWYFYYFGIIFIFIFILFCRTFEKIFIICVEILVKSKVLLLGFEP